MNWSMKGCIEVLEFELLKFEQILFHFSVGKSKLLLKMQFKFLLIGENIQKFTDTKIFN